MPEKSVSSDNPADLHGIDLAKEMLANPGEFAHKDYDRLDQDGWSYLLYHAPDLCGLCHDVSKVRGAIKIRKILLEKAFPLLSQ